MRSKTRQRVNATTLDVVKQNIVILRKKKGLTQTELGHKIGVTQRVMTYYENEAQNMSWDALATLAKALDVPTKRLLETDKDNVPDSGLSRTLQKKINLMSHFPPADQQYIAKMIDIIAAKNGLTVQVAGG